MPPEDRPSIFISYRRADAAANVGRLFDWLTRQFGESQLAFEQVFVDTDAIAPGDAFKQKILDNIAAANVVLVVIGPQWVDIANDAGRRLDQLDDYVRMEVTTALAGGKRIIPVLVGGAAMPSADQLPAPVHDLCKHSAIELRDAIHDFEHDFDRLVDAVLGRRRSRVKTEIDRSRRQLQAIKRSAWLAPLVAAIVILAVWVGLLDFFTLDTRAASYLLWAGEQISPAPKDPGVLLVNIDEASEQRLGREFGASPDWRRDHARLIDRAAAAGASAVVFDLFFERPSEADNELAAAASRARDQGTRVVFGARALDDTRPKIIEALYHPAGWGSVCINRRLGYTFAAPLCVLDPANRGQDVPRAAIPALALAATQSSPVREVDIDRRKINLAERPAGQAPAFTLIRKIRSETSACTTLTVGDEAAMLLIRFTDAGYWQAPGRHASYADALDPAVLDDAALRDRIVLVGVTLARSGDRHSVVSGFTRHTLYGVELHANAITNIATGREVVTPTLGSSAFIALGSALAGALLGWLTTPWPRWRARLIPVAVVLSYLGLASVTAGQGMLLHPLYDLTALFITYAALRRLRRAGHEPGSKAYAFHEGLK